MKEIAEHTCAAFGTENASSSSGATTRRRSTTRRRPSSRAACWPTWSARPTSPSSSRRWAPRTSATSCSRNPAATSVANGDGSHREGGHGMGPRTAQPELRLQRRPDPSAARCGCASPRPGSRRRGRDGDGRRRGGLLRPDLRRGAGKFLALRSRQPGRAQSRPPLLGRDGETLAMDVSRDGPASPTPSGCSSSAAPATASRASAARACGSHCSATTAFARPRGGRRCGAVPPRPQPYGFSWWRRTGTRTAT